MNNLGRNATQQKFDFTHPPPGYFAPGSVSKNYESSQADSKSGSKLLAKTEKGCNSPKEFPRTANHKYAFFQPTSGDSSLFKPRSPAPPQAAFQELSYRNRFPTQESSPTIDPRIYALPPPPPPPTEPYPTNLAVPAGQFVFNPAVYAAYPVPPPAMTASIGAGQYVTQQQEFYRPRQYQRGYSTGYTNRGGFYNHNIRKRKLPQEVDQNGSKKSTRKKKKSVSNNLPARKEWSVEDARRALEVEKEFNKRHKSQPLIIKFPDLELNREIVSKFHPKIDSVHFQQPSTPRFCFVTLKDSANVEEVMKELNKIKFGEGYLTAEPKKDREEDFNIGPEDIDPLNLYVGNLAQEVTVEDVVKAYPKNKRIDIGFAKKMKYTRYAFVCFHTVDDAIEAFQNTHATEMYNKSLIVRFRRLHGTVGLPGEPKPQNHNIKKNNDYSLLNKPDEKSQQQAHATKENNADSDLDNSMFPIKEEPKMSSYHYGSDDDDDDDEDEEELQYSNNIRNLVRNSLGDNAVTNIKHEPLDYDAESSYESYDPSNEKPHVPIVEVKSELDVKPPINIKKEKEELDDEDQYADTSFTSRRSSSGSFDDGESNLGDYSNDPLYGAFARASKFKM